MHLTRIFYLQHVQDVSAQLDGDDKPYRYRCITRHPAPGVKHAALASLFYFGFLTLMLWLTISLLGGHFSPAVFLGAGSVTISVTLRWEIKFRERRALRLSWPVPVGRENMRVRIAVVLIGFVCGGAGGTALWELSPSAQSLMPLWIVVLLAGAGEAVRCGIRIGDDKYADSGLPASRVFVRLDSDAS